MGNIPKRENCQEVEKRVWGRGRATPTQAASHHDGHGTVTGRKKRTRGAKKRAAGKVGAGPLGTASDQGAGLGHGSPEKEQPKAPGTISTGIILGESKSKREKVDREVERCCQCTRHSTCSRTYECRERGSACTNCMCL